MSESLTTIVQAGAIGVLVLVLVGLFLLAKLVAPAIREFFFGLTADIKANTAALNTFRETMIIEVRAVNARVDVAEERIKAHVTATANGVEAEVRDAANKTGEHVARTGEHVVAQTVGAAVEIARSGSSADIEIDHPRRPSPPTPIRGFKALRAPPPSSRGTTRRSVLVVEDDINAAKVIKQCLVAAIGGLVVNLAHTASDALTALGVANPALLPAVAVIDCNLGDGWGWEVANRAPRSVRIILMSGHVDAAMLSKLAEGVQAVWLRKPIEMDELVGIVRERLEAEVPA